MQEAALVLLALWGQSNDVDGLAVYSQALDDVVAASEADQGRLYAMQKDPAAHALSLSYGRRCSWNSSANTGNAVDWVTTEQQGKYNVESLLDELAL